MDKPTRRLILDEMLEYHRTYHRWQTYSNLLMHVALRYGFTLQEVRAVLRELYAEKVIFYTELGHLATNLKKETPWLKSQA